MSVKKDLFRPTTPAARSIATSALSKVEALPPADEVEILGIRLAGQPQVVPAVAGPAEGVGLPVDADAGDLALSVATLGAAVAGEGIPYSSSRSRSAASGKDCLPIRPRSRRRPISRATPKAPVSPGSGGTTICLPVTAAMARGTARL